MSVAVFTSTSSVTASGVATSQIEVVWTPPADAYVTGGGSMMIQTSSTEARLGLVLALRTLMRVCLSVRLQ